MSLAAGTRIGGYEVLGSLGAGGMGEVYRARDGRLGRDVALKVVPASLAADPERHVRLQREARVLATLNHPNIASIHGLEESGGITALVLELIEGPTLADRIARGPMPVKESLPIACQIAEALDAAHERGIVHRDLKPANIKVRPDGVVKVLDFGLAMITETSPSVAATVTASGIGTIAGTAAYMSPEQARAEVVDKRTDVWAFGCVLYEMLAGRQAFPGRTISDVIAAVLEREPDLSAISATAPPRVIEVIQRALAKDRRERLRDIGDALLDLRNAHDKTKQPSPSTRARHRVHLAWSLVVLTAGAAGFALFARSHQNVPPPLAPLKVERVTFGPGVSAMPAVSPDGRLLAYASDRAGRGDLDIWVQALPAGNALRVTSDPADDQMPDFSPDGTQIVFRSERDGGGLYVVSALGGGERLVGPDGRMPRFSPDGRQIAYWSGLWRGNQEGQPTGVYVLSLAGGTPRRLLPDFPVAREPVWTPDGRALIVLARRSLAGPLDQTYDLWWTPVDGGAPIRTGVLDQLDLRTRGLQSSIDFGGWNRGRLLVAIGTGMWAIPISSATGRVTGPPQPILIGQGEYGQPTVARNGDVVFEVGQLARALERAPIDGRPDTRPTQVLYTDEQGTAFRPSETADGTRLVFDRPSADGVDIVLKDTRSGEERTITRTESGTDPTIAPDGSRIGYTVIDRGLPVYGGEGFVVASAGGVAKPLCSGCTIHGFLSDNRRVIVLSDEARRVRLVNTESGESEDLVVVTDGRIDRPHLSSDDKWLVFRRTRTGRAQDDQVYVTRAAPGRPSPASAWMRVDQPTKTGRPCGWTLDSTTALLLLDTDGFRCLWGQKIDPVTGRLEGSPFPIRHFHTALMQEFSTSYGNPVSPLGFVYGAARLRIDLWRLQIP